MENGTGMVKVESGVGQAKIHLKTKTVVVTCLLQRKKRKLCLRLRREKWKQLWNNKKGEQMEEKKKKER